jgi:hypothetical protein
MNVEIGTEAAQFPEKEYINEILLAVRTDLSPGGIVLGPFVEAGLQADCVRTVRMQGVGIHVPG